jgi:hypothetical protein
MKSFTNSYNSLLKGISDSAKNNALNICTIFSPAQQQSPRSFGSSLSGIMTKGGMSGNHHEVQVTEIEKKTVACWIDLCAPHSGKYNSYMSATDSANYAKLEEKRTIWAAIEKENIRGLLAQTGVGHADYGRIIPVRSFTERFIHYAPNQRALVLNHPGQGNFMLIDLSGRTIFRMDITDRCLANVSIPLPSSLARGLYVARFIGEGLMLQRLVSVIR